MKIILLRISIILGAKGKLLFLKDLEFNRIHKMTMCISLNNYFVVLQIRIRMGKTRIRKKEVDPDFEAQIVAKKNTNHAFSMIRVGWYCMSKK